MHVPRERLEIRSARSGGPGGQNVNRVASKVEVRFHLESADWILPAVRQRLAELYPRRIGRGGDFIVVSSRYRTRQRNLEDCLAKLRSYLEAASRKPKRRVPVRPGRAVKEKRLESKRRLSERKRDRNWRPEP